MPRSDHPSHSWQAQRHYLMAAIDNLRTFLEITDEVEELDQPLTLVLDDTIKSGTGREGDCHHRSPSPRDEFPNTRRFWTFEEDNLLLSGFKLGMPSTQIAQALERTPDAVERRRRTLKHQGVL